MTTVPRLRLGNYGNGIVGLKTALPGFDVTVLADDNDGNKRSFNSQWSNIAKIQLIGIISVGSGATGNISTGLSYQAHFVVQRMSGVRVLDDGWTSYGGTGSGNPSRANNVAGTLQIICPYINTGGTFAYVIWQVAA